MKQKLWLTLITYYIAIVSHLFSAENGYTRLPGAAVAEVFAS